MTETAEFDECAVHHKMQADEMDQRAVDGLSFVQQIKYIMEGIEEK
jgi:hypothetical protein